MTFLLGAVANKDISDKYPMPENVKTAGLSERNWFVISFLTDTLPKAFGLLAGHVQDEPEIWRDYFISETPHKEKLPGTWDQRLTQFQKLVLLRVLREEKVVSGMKVYVAGTIGEYFTESPPFDLEGAYNDSVSVSPLIFILSSGADPTDYLLSLAESKGKGDNGLRIISLGQGQGPIAERGIEMAQRSGDWVCLQNCHLAVSWLARLEQIVERAQNEPDSVHQDFRLWLTSMPSQNFPVPVLQNGIKITNEPPRGLKANLLRTFNDISPEDYESCSKPSVYKKLLFATAFFNANILERRKFGAVGWNIQYEWMNSDLKAAMTQVKLYVEDQAEVPWETLNVQVSEITYGGRVTDTWDKRTISAILKKFFDSNLLDDSYTFTDDGVYYAPPPSDITVVRYDE